MNPDDITADRSEAIGIIIKVLKSVRDDRIALVWPSEQELDEAKIELFPAFPEDAENRLAIIGAARNVFFGHSQISSRKREGRRRAGCQR